MRLDDDNSRSYAPLLRRIFILVVVITAVPVMLWTITAFMRTYVAQPVIASARPLVPATLGSDTASGPSAAPAAADATPAQPPAIVEARATATDARNSDTDSKGNRANDTTASVTTAKVAALATADAPPSQPVMPAAPVAADTFASQPAASSPWPAVAPAPDVGAEPIAQADTSAADALPPAAPLTGPIPLPPRRPTVFALAETGGVPLPRARPAIAPEPTPPPSDTFPGYNPSLGSDNR
jgi:hypothetical protein